MESAEEIFAAIDECLQKQSQKPRISVTAILNKLSIETPGEDDIIKQKRVEMIDNLRDILLSPPAPSAVKPRRFLTFKTETPFEAVIKHTSLLLFQDKKQEPLDVLTPFIPPFTFLLEKMLFNANMFKDQLIIALKGIDWSRFRLVECGETLNNIGFTTSDFNLYKDLQQQDLNDMQIDDIYSETNKIKERLKKHVLFMKLFLKHKYVTVADLTVILQQILDEYFHLSRQDKVLYLIKNEISLSEYKLILFFKAFKFSKKMQTIINPIIVDILENNSFYRYKIKNMS